MSRPEHIAPPEVIYNEDGAKKYMRNSRMMSIQTKLSMRAIEMLRMPEDVSCLMLDIGCGAGLSGAALESMGHRFIGTDISRNMLDIAREEVDGDLLEHDMGLGLPFRPGSFDGAISISALQWLCNADKKSHIPARRLKKFFSSLYMVLRRGARAVLQFYPESKHQSNMILHHATKAGFSGGLVVDYPHSTRAKKYFLVLFAGPQSEYTVEAKTGDETESEDESYEEFEEDEEEEEGEDEYDDEYLATASRADTVKTVENSRKRKVRMTEREKRGTQARKKRKVEKHSKTWIINKKAQQEQKGITTRKTTKYTGRRRGPKF